MSYVCLYVGLDQSDQQLGFTGTNAWIFPGPEHDQYCEAFDKDPHAPFPLVFTSFPSSKDPTWAERYPNRATMELVAPANFEWFAQWKDARWMKRGSEYDALKDGFKNRLLEALYAHWPQARGHVKHAELSTPLSARHFAGHPHGELYGLSQPPERFLLRVRPRTKVQGFYLTGADVTMAGVCGAMMGGILTASAILGVGLLPKMMARKKVVQAA
jgi:phytoene dehydrogenase-like protein